jgi:uncharacterized Zn-binding protein involved in type VI secretion
MPAAARMGDPHTCPQATPGTPPVPHKGGPIFSPGCPTVLIAGRGAARVRDKAECHGPPDAICLGSPSVYIAGNMAARQGDLTEHGGSVTAGEPTVLIGGPTAQVQAGRDGRIKVNWGGLIVRGSPADVFAFLRMLAAEAARSRPLAGQLATYVRGDSGPIFCNVGRNQPSAIIDRWVNNDVDLDDLEAFRVDPTPGHPNEVTRGEWLSHFLAERDSDNRRSGVSEGRPAPTTPPTLARFNSAHADGVAAGNQVRAARGQSPALPPGAQLVTPAAGNPQAVVNFGDGTQERFGIGPGDAIAGITPP